MNPTADDDDRGDRRAGKRDQVEDRDEQAERDRVRDPEREQDERRRDARDHADEEVAGHVAADGPVDLVADAAPVGPRLFGSRRVEALHPDAGPRAA